MKMRSLLLVVFMLFIGGSAFGQKAKLSKANRYFQSLNYQEAIELYLEILDKRIVSEAKINLAECYRMIGNPSESEYWYSLVVRLPEAKPEHKLYYAMALQQNGKCDRARPFFEEYSEAVPSDLRGQLLLKSCDDIVYNELLERGAGFYEINNVASVNTEHDDFGAAFYEKGIVYSSEKSTNVALKRISTWTGRPFLDLYYSDVYLPEDGSSKIFYNKPEKFEGKLNTKFHDGPITVSHDGQKLFVTRNNIVNGKTGRDDEGIVRLRVLSADKVGEGWDNFKDLPFNSDEYSVTHPTITIDNSKLYFSSDMPGGFGGYDLYVSELVDGRWSAPSNLGARVNTSGNELFPFIYGTNEELYFASDGHTGRGGLDVFSCKINKNVFGAVFNLGYPVNTEKDDFGLVFNDDKTFGYFSSDREGGAGSTDIYNFRKVAVEVELAFVDEKSGEVLNNASVVSDCGYGEQFTDEFGKFYTELPLDKCCSFTITKDDYKQTLQEVCTKGYNSGSKMLVSVPVELDKSYEVDIAGVVLDEKTKSPVSGAAVKLLSNCNEEVLTATTNKKGQYSFKLNADCDYTLRSEKDNYLVGSGNFSTKDVHESTTYSYELAMTPIKVEEVYTISEPVATRPINNNTTSITNVLPQVVLENIYYNFDDVSIRNDARPELDELATYMKNNSDINVEIIAHTDNRGPSAYNKRLSERRAQSVVRYLINQGISPSRLVAIGSGEEVPLNHCRDGVPCSTEEYQLNRRTEFKLVYPK